MARVGEMVLEAAGNATAQGGVGEKLRGVGEFGVGKISNEVKARGEGKASDKEKADALISALFDWRSRAREQGGISSLSSYGFTSEHADAVLEQASNRKNPVGLDREQWREILLAAIG
jgi:alcohol dehydrogenase class IV